MKMEHGEALFGAPLNSFHLVTSWRKFTIIFINSTLIFSKTQEEHIVDVHQGVQQLQEYGLYAKLKKCSFDHNQVNSMDA